LFIIFLIIGGIYQTFTKKERIEKKKIIIKENMMDFKRRQLLEKWCTKCNFFKNDEIMDGLEGTCQALPPTPVKDKNGKIEYMRPRVNFDDTCSNWEEI